MKKGAKLYVEGQLSTRMWEDKTGRNNYSTEIKPARNAKPLGCTIPYW